MSENSNEADYAALAEWAEHEMVLPEDSTTALRGEAAAAYGREVLERAGVAQPRRLRSAAKLNLTGDGR